MKLESSKSPLNNQKGSSSNGKTTKSAAAFIKNKANFLNPEIGVSFLETRKYEILPACRGQKSNPIQSQFKPNHRKAKNEPKICYNNELQRMCPDGVKKTNPNKPKANPIQACPRMSQSGGQFLYHWLSLLFIIAAEY